MFTLVGNAQNDLSVSWDYQKLLRNTWSDCKARDWKVYSTEKTGHWWDVHVVEHRTT